MKARNIILLPLISAMLFTGCTKMTKYDPLNSIKYAAKQLQETYDELPRKGCYVVGKTFSGSSYEELKENFATYVPKGFDIKYDWYESGFVTGASGWNILYTNKYTEFEGELYYDKDCGQDCIQLWIVTSPLGDMNPRPMKTTYQEYLKVANEFVAKKCPYTKVSIVGEMSNIVSFNFDHEFMKTEEGWVLVKGDAALEEEARELIEFNATQVENSDENSYYVNNDELIASYGYGAYTFDEYGLLNYVRAKKGSMRMDVDVTWSK